jgi:hypothetical protein
MHRCPVNPHGDEETNRRSPICLLLFNDSLNNACKAAEGGALGYYLNLIQHLTQRTLMNSLLYQLTTCGTVGIPQCDSITFNSWCER